MTVIHQKGLRAKDFFWFQRLTKSKTLISDVPVVNREFYILKGFRNRLGDISLTKTLSGNIYYTMKKVLFLSSKLKSKSKSTDF